ncbi:hypothetical protein JCM10212_003908 [Sporobolomyces blumeae]
MPLSASSVLLRSSTLRLSSPLVPFAAGSGPLPRSFSTTTPHRAAPSISAEQDHYTNLGVAQTATRKQIKDKFYELSRKYHPDAPSTSSMTPDQRTERFQQLSQSYSVLSDPSSRKSYDLSRGSSGSPAHRRGRSGHHPGYTRASGGMGYAGGGGGGAYASRNEERRQNANYAWKHPSARGGPTPGSTASADASSRPNPFATRANASGAADHLERFAKRARMRQEQTIGRDARGSTDGHYRAGTAVFGRAKAEEESRLINDSSTLRSSQVLFVFGSVFVLAWLFSGGHDRHEQNRRR